MTTVKRAPVVTNGRVLAYAPSFVAVYAALAKPIPTALNLVCCPSWGSIHTEGVPAFMPSYSS